MAGGTGTVVDIPEMYYQTFVRLTDESKVQLKLKMASL